MLSGRPWCQRTFSALSPNGVRSSVLNFLAGTIGAGLLSLPYAVATCGVGLGVLLLVFVGWCFYLFYGALVQSCERLKEFTYVRAMMQAYGWSGKLICQVVVFIFQLGALATMNNMLCSFSLQTLREEYAMDVDPNAIQPRMLFLGLLLIVQIPLVLSEKVQTLRFASGASLCCVLYVALVVVLQAPAYIERNLEPVPAFQWNLKVQESLGVIFFSYHCTLLIPMLYDELERRSVPRMLKVLRRGFLSLGALYIAMAVAGAYSYAGPQLPTMVVLRPRLNPAEPDWLMLVGRTGYLVNLVMHIPFTLYPLRLATLQFLAEDLGYTQTRLQFLVITLLYLLIPISVAVLVPEILNYFKLLGGVFSLLLAIIFPCEV